MPIFLLFEAITLQKPGVNRSVHLFLAPLLWSSVGAMLIFRGVRWLMPSHHQLLLLFAALLLGSVKSYFVIDKSVKKSIHRITRFNDGTCLGAVYSWQTWLLVFIMMLFGITLRHLFHPGTLMGLAYCAIGWALCLSSRHGWVAWYAQTRGDDEQ